MKLTPKPPGSLCQYGEKNFRRFEPQINQVLNAWPNKITFRTVTITACSWKSLFRAACQAFIHDECHWTAAFTKQEIIDLFEQLVISPNDAKQTVDLYPKDSTPDDREVVPFSLSAKVINVRDDELLLRALLLLKDRELVKDQIQISGISLQVLEAYKDEFQNVSIIQDEPGVLTIF